MLIAVNCLLSARVCLHSIVHDIQVEANYTLGTGLIHPLRRFSVLD